jgi:hypothetical protein
MSMRVQALIDEVLWYPNPPQKLLDSCGEYYAPYYYLMHLLVKYQMAWDGKCVALELGVEKGRGVTAMAMAHPNAVIMGYDSTQRPELADVLIKYPNIKFQKRPSMPAPEYSLPIDILHIDTEHSYSMAKAEFEAYKPFLKDGAVVLFDDLHAMEDSVLRFFNELPYAKIQEDRLHPVCGYGVVLYEH